MKAVEESARIAAIESSADGICWTFSPMVDICRDARWGRVSEGNGEDPFLGAAIAQAMVRGYQGKDMSRNDEIMACVKHFALYGVLCLQYEAAYLEVREAQNLGLAQYLGRNLLQCVVFRKLVLVVYNILHALDEPRVDLGQLLDALDGVAFLQSLGDGKDTEVGRIGKLLIQVVELGVVVAYETVHSLTDHAQTLLEHLLHFLSHIQKSYLHKQGWSGEIFLHLIEVQCVVTNT